MKKIVLFSLLLIFSIAKATHNRSGEILYKRIAPFSQVLNGATVQVYTYSITVIKYTDDGPTVADRCVDTVNFGDGSKGIAPRINGLSASCQCGTLNGNAIGCGSLIVNNPGYKVKLNVYSVIHTYSSPGSYFISSTDPNRNAGIHNIPNSINTPFIIHSMLVINSTSGINSSPVLTNPPVDQATVGVCFYHNMGAIDADGDSLSYQITTCAAPNYSYPELGAQNTFSIDPVTGLLNWCTPQFIDAYSIALIVKEWRKKANGVHELIGYVLRDMEVLVKYGVVGINENNLAANANIYPNPCTEKLKIDLGGSFEQVKSSIYGIDGKEILKMEFQHVNGELTLNVNTLKPGIYMLSIQTDSGTFYKKIIKE